MEISDSLQPDQRHREATHADVRNWVVVFRMIPCILAAVLIMHFLQPSLALATEDTLILVGVYSGMDQANAVSAYHKNAYVADGPGGLWVIDYSSPTSPDSLTHFPHMTHDIAMEEHIAYYVGDCFRISDVSDPLQPESLAYCCCWANHHLRIHLFDSLALTMLGAPTGECYMILIDISDPYSPEHLSITYAPPYGTQYGGDAYVKDHYALWADAAYLPEEERYIGRLIVFDITDPSNPDPIVIDTCLQAIPRAIEIRGDYAYVAEGYGGRGLMVFDVSDPYSIDSIGCFAIPEGRAWNVHIDGDYAYVSAHLQPTLETDRIYALDIADPSNPTLIASYDTPGSPQDIFVDKPYVLVAELNSLLILKATFLHKAGDVNGDDKVDVGDVVFLLNYLFKEGSPPNPLYYGDVNGDSEVNLEDVVYLLNYLYKDGPSPQDGCAP